MDYLVNFHTLATVTFFHNENLKFAIFPIKFSQNSCKIQVFGKMQAYSLLFSLELLETLNLRLPYGEVYLKILKKVLNKCQIYFKILKKVQKIEKSFC